AQDVPGLRDQRGVERHHHEVERGARAGDERHAGHQQHKESDQAQLAQAAGIRCGVHARAPKRPSGLNSTTAMKITKMPICPSDPPRYSPPSDSTMPIRKPPTSAPTKLPMPPSTTMVKATSTKPPPTCGLT